MTKAASGPEPRIRQIGAFDIALLAELHKAIFTAPWDRPWSAESLAQSMSMPGACGWLLEREGRPLGFLLGRFTLDEGEILLTGILPDARGQGHGARLMHAAIGAARAGGLARLFLEHAASNAAASHLYHRLGFREIGRRAKYYGNPARPDGREDAIALMLELTTAEPATATRIDDCGE